MSEAQVATVAIKVRLGQGFVGTGWMSDGCFGEDDLMRLAVPAFGGVGAIQLEQRILKNCVGAIRLDRRILKN